MFVIVCFGKHKWWYLGNEVVRSRGSGKKGRMSSQPVGTTLASRAARQSPKAYSEIIFWCNSFYTFTSSLSHTNTPCYREAEIEG